MTHNEKRGSTWREAQLGLFTGSIYGGTHTLTGHPLDTIKSKMQIQKGYTGLSALETTKLIYKTEGLIGYYRGCIPPLWGSMVYRGIMMSAYEFAVTYFESNYDATDFPKRDLLFGIRPMIPAASLLAAAVRCIIESPIEYAKVMGQTGKKWQIKDMYRGFGYQVVRTTGLITPIYTMIDIARHKTNLLNSLWGNFMVTFGASFVSYWICWPLETLKNLSQSGTPFPNATIKQKLEYLGGPIGLYRGVMPGTLAGGIRNGCGMVAMVYAQKWATKLGLR